MLRFSATDKAATVVVSMRMDVELASWIQECAGEKKRSTAAVIILQTLRETMPNTDLDGLLREIRRRPRHPDRDPHDASPDFDAP